MPFSHATTLEVLRLKTFVPVVDHATLCDTEVGGYFVPKGTTVSRWVSRLLTENDGHENDVPSNCSTKNAVLNRDDIRLHYNEVYKCLLLV